MRVFGFFTLLLLLLTPSLTGAQTFEVSFSYPSNSSDNMTETTAGFFDRDCLEDIVYLQGTDAILLSGPALYAQGHRVPAYGAVSAIATLPGSETDEILVADNNGLKAFMVSQAGFTSRPISGPEWANARAIAVGTVETTSGVPAIYGISADGTQVLTYIDGVNSTIPATEAFDLVALDWTAELGGEILAVSAMEYGQSWIVFLRPDGTSISSLWTPQPSADLGVVRGMDGDRVAAVGKAPVGLSDWLVILDPTLTPDFMDLGNIDAVGLDCGDVNGDGWDDVVVSHQSSDSIIFAPHPFVVGTEIALVGGETVPNTTESHTPVLLDADQDEDLDLIQLSNSDSAGSNSTILVHLQEASTLPTGGGQVDFGGTNPYQPNLREFRYFDVLVNGATQETGFLCYEFEQPVNGYPQGTTHVEVGVWKSEYQQSGQGGTWRPAEPIGRIYTDVGNSTTQHISLEIDLPTVETVYFWAARYVVTSDPVNQNYARVYPPIIYTFTPTLIPSISGPLPPSIDRLTELNGSYDVTTLEVIYDPETERPPYLNFWGLTAPPWAPDPSNTGTGTPVRPLPDPSEFPDPGFGDAPGAGGGGNPPPN